MTADVDVSTLLTFNIFSHIFIDECFKISYC